MKTDLVAHTTGAAGTKHSWYVMGESSGSEKGVQQDGNLWPLLLCLRRYSKSWGLLGQQKQSRGISFPPSLFPPLEFKEGELPQDKWKVKRRRIFLRTGAEEFDCRCLGRVWSLLMG